MQDRSRDQRVLMWVHCSLYTTLMQLIFEQPCILPNHASRAQEPLAIGVAHCILIWLSFSWTEQRLCHEQDLRLRIQERAQQICFKAVRWWCTEQILLVLCCNVWHRCNRCKDGACEGWDPARVRTRHCINPHTKVSGISRATPLSHMKNQRDPVNVNF